MVRGGFGFAVLAAAVVGLGWGIARADVSPSGSSATPAANPRARFEGTFVFAGGSRERAGVRAAIERAIDGMFFIAQPIARSKLREKNRVHAWLGFHFHDGLLTATAPGTPPIVSRDDGTPITYTALGETMTVRQRLTRTGHLVETFHASQGNRTNDFSIGPDGTLRLSATVSSPQLPRDVRFRLTYRRR